MLQYADVRNIPQPKRDRELSVKGISNMSESQELWIDGEKIPDEKIQDVFRPSPSVPTSFHRSALIIGSKGAGKTTLFRYLKSTHGGLAIHISLATEFGSIAKQSAFGPLSIQYPSEIEQLIVGKATSLLAVSVLTRMTKKNIAFDREAALGCFPSTLISLPTTIDLNWCLNAKDLLAKSSLESFRDVFQTKPLFNLVTSFGDLCRKQYGGLLVLLDRADMIATPALVPTFDLLDQSGSFVALVATRPGHGNSAIMRLCDSAVPGDHYDVFHLGLFPRSTEWEAFVYDAVMAQLGDLKLKKIDSDIISLVLLISRDSTRTALELFARAIAIPPRKASAKFIQAIEDLRDSHLAAVQRTLRPYHPDFRALLNDIRNELIRSTQSVRYPVLLTIPNKSPEDFFESNHGLSLFSEAALRSGALCMPEAERWVPGCAPTTFEVPPLFLYRKEDGLLVKKNEKPTLVERKEADLLRTPHRPAQEPTIFIAYRIKSKESRLFRDNIAQMVSNHPTLSAWKCVDGHVPVGANWPEAIRNRIKKSKLVVGDVTGMRPDVLFELGFAFGLRRHLIPVVNKAEDRAKLPHWIGFVQIGTYDDIAGLRAIVSSVESHILDPEFSGTSKSPPPTPGLAVWLRVLNWNQGFSDQFKTLAEREGLLVEVYADTDPIDRIIERGASASLLCVNLDGTESDSLIHYVCGAVISKPSAGYGSKMLKRTILVVESTPSNPPRFAADSLSRCEDTVRVIGLNQLADKIKDFGRQYLKWLGTGGKTS